MKGASVAQERGGLSAYEEEAGSLEHSSVAKAWLLPLLIRGSAGTPRAEVARALRGSGDEEEARTSRQPQLGHEEAGTNMQRGRPQYDKPIDHRSSVAQPMNRVSYPIELQRKSGEEA